ncbi:MAG: hypothetical protein ACYTGV_16815 [Planctomycetota bacterium]|jgi:hypothetical protein
MRTITICLLVAGLLAVTLGGCGKCEDKAMDTPGAKPSDTPAMDTTAKACVCEAGKKGATVLCPDCDVGYVKGDKTACKTCFASATGGPACETCAKK